METRFVTRLADALSLLVLCVGSAQAQTNPRSSDDDMEARIAALMARPNGLTANEVARRAAETSFDVEAKRADLDAAIASVNQAVAGFVPRLGGVARYERLSHITPTPLGVVAVPISQTAGPVSNVNQLISIPLEFDFPDNSTTFSASLTVPISDYVFRIAQSYRSATHARDAAKLNMAATQLKSATDGRVLYYAWARACLQTLVAEQALAQAQGHLSDVNIQFEAGAVSKADVLRVQSQLSQSELLVERARNAVAVSEEQLRVALHNDSENELQIGEDLNGAVDTTIANESAASLMAEARKSRLEVRALAESRDSVVQQAKGARAGYYPVLIGIADAVYANPNPRIIPPEDKFDFTWDAGVQLTWSPNDVAVANSVAKNVDARARGLEAQRKQLEDGLRNEVVQARSALREAVVAISTTQRGLQSSEESYRVRRQLFMNGRATSVELTDAETDLTRARLDAVNAKIDVRVAQARLIHAVGRDIPQG